MRLAHGYFTGLLLVLMLLAGCGSDPKNRHFDDKGDTEARAVAAHKTVLPPIESRSMVSHNKGLWIEPKAIALGVDAELPTAFTKPLTLRFSGRQNLRTLAERITRITGVPVNLTPDVFLSFSRLVPGGGQQAAPNGANSSTQLAPNGAPINLQAGFSSGMVTAGSSLPGWVEDFDMNVEVNNEGTLLALLDSIASRLGVNWEYRQGEIKIYRLATRSFALKAVPGNTAFSSTIGKTGGATVAATGGAGASSGVTGSLSADVSTKIAAGFSAWQDIEKQVRSMLSPVGKMAISESTGTLTVTDSRDVLRTVEVLIDRENTILTQQIAFRVEVLSVSLTNGDQFGIDWGVVWSRLNALSPTAQFKFNSPTSVTSAPPAGSIGLSVLQATDDNSLMSRLNGSNLLFQALSSVSKTSVITTASTTTLNRKVAPLAITKSVSYLAQTTPGSSSSGTGLVTTTAPTLTPGNVTTGVMLNLLPTLINERDIALNFWMDISSLDDIKTVTSGTGSSMASIQTPEISGTQFSHNVSLRAGDTLVLSGFERSIGQYDRRALGNDVPVGLGGSIKNGDNREVIVLLITPYVSDAGR